VDRVINLKNKLVSRWKRLIDFVGEAVAQAVFVLFFSFTPIIALSFSQVGKDVGFITTFKSYFANGEIAFLTFGVVGSVFWCILSRNMTFFFKALGLLVAVAVLWLSASAIDTDASSKVPPEQNSLLVAMYLIIVFTWFLSMLPKPSESASNSAEDADDLIKRSR